MLSTSLSYVQQGSTYRFVSARWLFYEHALFYHARWHVSAKIFEIFLSIENGGWSRNLEGFHRAINGVIWFYLRRKMDSLCWRIKRQPFFQRASRCKRVTFSNDARMTPAKTPPCLRAQAFKTRESMLISRWKRDLNSLRTGSFRRSSFRFQRRSCSSRRWFREGIQSS